MPAAVGSGSRPKTMAETMEDMLLEPTGPPCRCRRPACRRPRRLRRHRRTIDDDDVEVSELGVTVAQPDTGALRPT